MSLSPIDIDDVRFAKRVLQRWLEGKSGIVSIGISRPREGGDYFLLVGIDDEIYGEGLPEAVGGIAVKLDVTGSQRAF